MLRPLDAALERWSGAADLEHPTYYDARHLDRSAGRGLVTTVLDMIPEMLPGQVRAESHESKLALVSASSLVVCISEAVRTDLLRIAGDPGVPVIACPLGVRIDTDPVPTIDERPGAPPIALFVGSRAGYKRFDVLLAALSGAGAPQLDLVCVGGGPWTAPEQQAIGSLAEGVTARQVDADDDELRDWYRRARVLVSTSAGEGFGLPVLEAMAAGCPVVATDIPVYREVVGAAGTFVPVGEPEALRDGIGRVVGDSAAARRAASTGLEVAREASWSRSAERLAAAYRSIR
jgi:glycosyltransferase involved in cell wall biosynthesis